METYHAGDTYPPMDFLLTRNGVYVDPSGATQVYVQVRINGVHTLRLSANLSTNVSIVVDGEAYNRVRIRFVDNDLSDIGIYQVQVVLTWADGTETTPIRHEFKVVEAWA